MSLNSSLFVCLISSFTPLPSRGPKNRRSPFPDPIPGLRGVALSLLFTVSVRAPLAQIPYPSSCPPRSYVPSIYFSSGSASSVARKLLYVYEILVVELRCFMFTVFFFFGLWFRPSFEPSPLALDGQPQAATYASCCLGLHPIYVSLCAQSLVPPDRKKLLTSRSLPQRRKPSCVPLHQS